MGSGVTSAAHEKQGLYPLWLAFVDRHPVALDQLENGNENDRAYSCRDDRPEPPGNRNAKPTADLRADNADDDVAPSAERVAGAQRQIDVGRKERVRQVVRRHLRTPTLEAKTLARLVGMSRSNLYRLFEDTGGVARYIQRERLLEAHAVLTNPANSQSISAIAEDLCFADASSFSRCC